MVSRLRRFFYLIFIWPAPSKKIDWKALREEAPQATHYARRGRRWRRFYLVLWLCCAVWTAQIIADYTVGPAIFLVLLVMVIGFRVALLCVCVALFFLGYHALWGEAVLLLATAVGLFLALRKSMTLQLLSLVCYEAETDPNHEVASASQLNSDLAPDWTAKK